MKSSDFIWAFFIIEDFYKYLKRKLSGFSVSAVPLPFQVFSFRTSSFRAFHFIWAI
ncbi:hypothetical protein [Pedobacter sp.]|uniref:hypothetical protein n=1 Tax=Pedobacter sp. TaxID=1411316 RepID=UPI003BA9E8EA